VLGDPDGSRDIMTDFDVTIVQAPDSVNQNHYVSSIRRPLSRSQVDEVKSKHEKSGWSLRRLAKEYGVSHETIRRLLM
jgi:ribosome-binding protein aMBF1 (putative translation factor)